MCRIIDVLIIAAGFVLRVAAGVSVVNVERFSPWLYVVTTLFALYIGFGKRRAELSMSIEANGRIKPAESVLDGYTIPFLGSTDRHRFSDHHRLLQPVHVFSA
jgi:hypothetical protein